MSVRKENLKPVNKSNLLNALSKPAVKEAKFVIVNKTNNSSKDSSKVQMAQPSTRDFEQSESLKSLLKRANEGRFYNNAASYLVNRSTILRFIEAICCHFEYTQNTYYLSINIMDKLLSKHNFSRRKLDLVCFMIVNIAAKQHERRGRLSGFDSLVIIFRGKYDVEIMRNLEIMILKLLDFKTCITTVFDIVHEFVRTNEMNNNPDLAFRNKNIPLIKEFENAVLLFIEISANHYEFYQFSATTVAISCIKSAEKMLNKKFSIPQNIKILLKESKEEILCCGDLLYNSALKTFQAIEKPKVFKNTFNRNKVKNNMYKQLNKINYKKSKVLSKELDPQVKIRGIHGLKSYYLTYNDLSVSKIPVSWV